MSHQIKKVLTHSLVDVAQSLGGIDVVSEEITADITSAVFVGKGNVVKLQPDATTPTAISISFGPSTLAAVSNQVIKYEADDFHRVYHMLATDDYMIASTNTKFYVGIIKV